MDKKLEEAKENRNPPLMKIEVHRKYEITYPHLAYGNCIYKVYEYEKYYIRGNNGWEYDSETDWSYIGKYDLPYK